MGRSSTSAAADRGQDGKLRSGFWAGYRKTLKPLAVEEPVDVWLHRPLAYLLTRALFPTPISPNTVTLLSIASGLLAGVSLVVVFPWHMQVAGLAIFMSAVFDCADGQLARMRGTASAFGRMLDGVADFVVASAAVGGAMWVVASEHAHPWWLGLAALGLAMATAVTGSFHTSMYDHFKNLYLRFTSPAYREGEDLVTARQRYEDGQNADWFGARLAWPIYLFYVESQANVVRGFDPNSTVRLDALPGYDVRRARIYEKHMAGLMRVWRTWFGFGSLVFGLAVSSALDILDYYMLFRLLALNALFYGWLRPAQRRASRAAFAEMGLLPPEQQETGAAAATAA